MKTNPDDDVTEAEEKRAAGSEETMHPQEDLTHGDEGVDDPVATPEDATEVTTNLEGDAVDAGNMMDE